MLTTSPAHIEQHPLPGTQSRSGWRFMLLAAVGAVAAISMIPFVYLLVRASDKPIHEIVQLLFRQKTLEVLATTASLVFCVVVINLVLGVAIASGLHFVQLPFRRLLVIPMVLPLAIPSYVLTYTWVALVPSFSGFAAAVFILSISTIPYIIFATLAGLRSIDGSQIEVARSLGLNPAKVFSRVVFPQIRGHVSAGALLAGLYTMSDFGAVSLLNVETLTVTIQNMYRASYDRSAAAVISFVLIAFSILFVMGNESIKGRSTNNQLLKSLSVKTPLIQKTYLKFATVSMIIAFATLAVIVPFYVLLTRFFSNPVAIDWSSLASATFSTVSVAALGAFIALVLSAPLGYLLSAAPSRFARVTNKMVIIAHALPGVVVGLALVSIGSKLGGLYQTTFLLACAYAILFLAKSVTSMSSSLARVPNGVKDVAATLGMNQWAVVKKVIAPIAAPGIGIGTILVFLTAMKELPATLMLRPTGFETLATQIWSSGSINRFNEAAPYALILVLVAAIPTFLISRPDKEEQSFNYENAGGPSERS